MCDLEDGQPHDSTFTSTTAPATESTPLLVTPATQTYSIFTNRQKQLIILAAALASAFSPLSANIYFPALNSIAEDLKVTRSQINLTITTYMIFQGLAPTFTGSLADQAGRRPAYIYCFIVYIASNIALAIQHSFPTLLILRAVQSCGSSGTVALASAVAADIIIPAERGAYMGIASLGNILAPSLGPIAGGLLSQYLGWQAVFWFLTILASAFFLPFLLFFPETCRAIVDDGTLAVSRWNRPRWKLVSSRRSRSIGGNDPEISTNSYRSSQAWKIPNPWSSLRLLFRRPIGLVLLANGVIFGGYYAVTAGIPGQLGELYQLNDLWIGFCFIPAGLASLLSATLNGFLVDWNYRRMNKQTGESSTGNPKHNNNNFPVERARLQICIPMTFFAALSVAGYGTLIAGKCRLWIALLMIFAICFCLTASYNVMNVLVVDLYYSTPATAMAANNLVRCSLGAGAAAIVNPLIKRIGVQWTYVSVSASLLGIIPLLLLVYNKGWAWRREQMGAQI